MATFFRRATLELLCIAMGAVLLLAAVAIVIVGIVGAVTGNFAPYLLLYDGLYSILFVILGIFCLVVARILKLLAHHIEQTDQQHALLEKLQAPPTSAPQTQPPAAVIPDLTRTQILELLQHLRDAAMMDDAQRQHCAARHWAKRKDSLMHLVDRHILSGDWSMARSRLDELCTLLPTDPDVQTLAERLASEHAARLCEDLTTARAHLRRLTSLTAWQEAEEIVTSLQHKYPHEEQVRRLTADLAHEREKLDRQHRDRLLAELADATEHHHWRRAITAAEEFIQRHPQDPVSERLQFDLATLHENAATHDRKEQESRFKDLLKHHHYEEAENVAKSLIQQYPTSPAAAELIKMLPRVEELHRQETLKRQLAATATGD
jgi:hypothetical protein